MRCKSCNAPLSIDDEKCPYCGTPNPEAIKHRQDMSRFSGEFHRTKSFILRTSTETAQKSIRITIICVLIVLVFVACFFMGNSWNIASAIHNSQANKNYPAYSALLDQYEAENDPLSFVALYDENYLYGVEKYDKYQYYYRAAQNYQSIYFELLRYLENQDDEYASHSLKYLFDSIDYYYSYLEEEHYDFYMDTGMYDEVHLQAVDHMTQKLEALLQFSFSLSDEEMANFQELSTAEKQVLIERRIRENE